MAPILRVGSRTPIAREVRTAMRKTPFNVVSDVEPEPFAALRVTADSLPVRWCAATATWGDPSPHRQRGVTARRTTPLGDTATLRILGVGTTSRELALASPTRRSATITDPQRRGPREKWA